MRMTTPNLEGVILIYSLVSPTCLLLASTQFLFEDLPTNIFPKLPPIRSPVHVLTGLQPILLPLQNGAKGVLTKFPTPLTTRVTQRAPPLGTPPKHLVNTNKTPQQHSSDQNTTTDNGSKKRTPHQQRTTLSSPSSDKRYVLNVFVSLFNPDTPTLALRPIKPSEHPWTVSPTGKSTHLFVSESALFSTISLGPKTPTSLVTFPFKPMFTPLRTLT